MNVKKNLQDRLRMRNEGITELREQQGIIQANIGQIVAEKDKSPKPELKDIFDNVQNLVSEIHKTEDALRRVLDDDDRRQSINDELKNLSEELKALELKQEAASEDVGRAAWDLWKVGRLADNRYQEAMTNLVMADEKLRHAEDLLYRQEQDSGKEQGIKNLLLQGKTFLLSNKKRLASSALNREWGPAGLKIIEVEDRQAFEGTPVLSAFATYDALVEQKLKILKKEEKLKSEYKKIEADFEELPGTGGVKRRRSHLEKELDVNRAMLEKSYSELGREWLKTADSVESPVELVERQKELEETESQIADLVKEKGTLVARLELLDLESRRDLKSAGVERLEIEVQERQTALKERKKELSSLEKEIAKRRESLPPEPGLGNP